MGENSKIEWADHTFNPWIGCQKVSPGCDHCYAEALARRYGWVTWGPHGERKRTSAANWRKPLQWAKAARATGARPRVFCASLADVFDNQVPVEWRGDLFKLIYSTPELDWQLLTKRPENLARFFPSGEWPNIWLGTTVENQEQADRRIPLLLAQHKVARYFLSCEPLLGSVTISYLEWSRVNWVICGGESGRAARPMHPNWARSLRDQCAAAGVPFFFKQWGEYAPCETWPPGTAPTSVVASNGRHLVGRGVLSGEPQDEHAEIIGHFGKRRSGRLLDGREHNAFPAAAKVQAA